MDIFSFVLIMKTGKAIKTLRFYSNAYLHDLSRLYNYSLTEIQYLQIEPSEKKAHTNKHMML